MSDIGQSTGTVTTSPHSFHPLRPWDVLHRGGRCRACRLPKDAHPIRYWAPSRAIGDKSEARLTWENLNG